MSKLRDLSGTSWDQDTYTILLEAEHYQGHTADHPKDAEFLNTPIQNYSQMQQIFFFGMATGKHVGSSEPLGWPMPDYPDTQELKAVLDGPDKGDDHVLMLDSKRKRGGLMEDELSVFSSITDAGKVVATVIRESKPVDV